MDPTIQAELECQQSAKLDKLSSIMDNKLDSMKRKLEESSNTQMSKLKKIRLSETRSFNKKGHEQQYKHNDQVKSAVNEGKDAAIAGKTDACIAKLNEGIHLIDQCQKLILIADRSEYGWKTVGEHLDNELADDEQDAKKMKKAEKEAQRKIAKSRTVKAGKVWACYKTSIRTWRHFEICQATGVLIVPLWRGALFWPCVCLDGTRLAKCIVDWVGVPEFYSATTTKGRTHNSLFHGEMLDVKLIALYIDWQSVRNNDRGFCLSVKGLCDHCKKG